MLGEPSRPSQATGSSPTLTPLTGPRAPSGPSRPLDIALGNSPDRANPNFPKSKDITRAFGQVHPNFGSLVFGDSTHPARRGASSSSSQQAAGETPSSRSGPPPLPAFLSGLTAEATEANRNEIRRLIEIYNYRIRVANFSKHVSFGKMELLISSLRTDTSVLLADFIRLPLPPNITPSDPAYLAKRKQQIRKEITRLLDEQREYCGVISSLENRNAMLDEMLARFNQPEYFSTSMRLTLDQLGQIPDTFVPRQPFPSWQPFGEARVTQSQQGQQQQQQQQQRGSSQQRGSPQQQPRGSPQQGGSQGGQGGRGNSGGAGRVGTRDT
jgi:hypothetical protein